MNKPNDARYKADKRVQDFNEKYKDDLLTIVEYAEEKSDFNGFIAKVEKSMQNEATDILAISDNKKEKKIFMAKLVNKYSERASVKASQAKNTKLEDSLNKPVTFISKAKDDNAVVNATSLKDIMKNNSTILTNINVNMIAEMETAITDFSDVKNNVKEAIELRKSSGTEHVSMFLTLADVPKTNMGKLIHSYLPHLADEWDEISKVGKSSGVRHVSLIVRYKDSITKVPLKNVICTITNGLITINRKSTKVGSVQQKSMEGGNWTVSSQFPNYVTDVRENIGIEDKKIIRIDIFLVKE